MLPAPLCSEDCFKHAAFIFVMERHWFFWLAWQLSPASRQLVLAATPALWPAGHSLHAATYHFQIRFLKELQGVWARFLWLATHLTISQIKSNATVLKALLIASRSTHRSSAYGSSHIIDHLLFNPPDTLLPVRSAPRAVHLIEPDLVNFWYMDSSKNLGACMLWARNLFSERFVEVGHMKEIPQA